MATFKGTTPGNPGQQFHLIVAESYTGRSPVPVGMPPTSSVVPEGVTRLSYPPGGVPELFTDHSADSPVGFFIEPVYVEHQPFLVLVNTGDRVPRVNGMPAPPVVFLRDRDVLQFADERALQVALFNQLPVGPPPPGVIGKECPYCRVPIQESAMVYLCACGAAIHVKGAPAPAEEGLECLKWISECPICQRPIVKSAGYAYPLDEVADE